jgi:5-carboxymethyl-2-hydroxymuconate isomerase
MTGVRAPPFNQYLGIRVLRMEGGDATAVIELAPHHTNNRGVAHGGVMSSLLDSAMGAAVISAIPKEWWCATTGLSIQFLAGPREGTIEATGKVVRRGRSIAFATGEARDANGGLVATAHGTWHLWPHKPEVEGPETEAYVVVQGSGERLRVGKILAVGRNYADHNAEMGNAPSVPPVLFLKPPSALVHDGGVVVLPTGMGQLHHEVELVVAIGRKGRAISEGAAVEHVLGYAVGLDLTLRDLQSEAKKKGEPWDLSKGFDGAAPVSQVVPRELAGDVTKLALTLEVNGDRRQDGVTGQMLHDVAALVAYSSRWITLERGDLLFTGTPSGVGPLVAGDRVVARLSDLAMLTVTIAAAS